jgi:hypothetical protein
LRIPLRQILLLAFLGFITNTVSYSASVYMDLTSTRFQELNGLGLSPEIYGLRLEILLLFTFVAVIIARWNPKFGSFFLVVLDAGLLGDMTNDLVLWGGLTDLFTRFAIFSIVIAISAALLMVAVFGKLKELLTFRQPKATGEWP